MISDFINKPMIRGFSKFSSNVLNTMFMMKGSHPIAAVAAGASLVNSLAESFDLHKISPLDSYIRANKLVPCIGTLSRLVYMSDYFKDSNSSVVFSSEEEDLIEIEVDPANKFYIVEFKNEHVSLGADRGQKVSDEFFFTDGFNFELLFDKIWNYYKNGIFLKRNKTNFSIELKSLPVKTPIYIGEHDLADFYKRLRRSIDANISRSYLLNGPPGAGKSSFAMKIASDYFKRIVKIDPSMARSLEAGELEFFVEQLRPDVLIFEDFDRAFTSADVALFMLENLKESFPKLVIFGTVNNLDKLDKALIRPGRFDQILWFGCPNSVHRRQILNLYFNEFGNPLENSLLDRITEASENLSPVYLKELAIESRNLLPADFEEELFCLIDDFLLRSYIETDTGEDQSDDENSNEEEMEISQQMLNKIEWDELHADPTSDLD